MWKLLLGNPQLRCIFRPNLSCIDWSFRKTCTLTNPFKKKVVCTAANYALCVINQKLWLKTIYLCWNREKKIKSWWRLNVLRRNFYGEKNPYVRVNRAKCPFGKTSSRKNVYQLGKPVVKLGSRWKKNYVFTNTRRWQVINMTLKYKFHTF